MSTFSSIGAGQELAVGAEALTRKAEELRTQPYTDQALQAQSTIHQQTIAMNEQTLRAAQFDQAKKEEEYAHNHEWLPVSQLVGNQPKAVQDYLMDYAKSRGAIKNIGGVDSIQRVEAQNLYTDFSGAHDKQLELDQLSLDHINQQMANIATQLQDPKVKDKDKQALLQQLQGYGADQKVLVNSISDLQSYISQKSSKPAEFYDPSTNQPVKEVNGRYFTPDGKPFAGEIGSLRKVGVSTEPTSDFKTFAEGMRDDLIKKGITETGEQDRQISKAWEASQLKIAQAKSESQITARMKDIDVPKLAKSVTEGHESIEGITNAFGVPVKPIVQSEILKEYPKFDFVKSDANKRYTLSPANLRSAGLAMSVYPRVESLKEKASKLSNLDPRILNMPVNEVNKQFGGTEVVDYESMRNAIIQEVNTALSGSSSSSDMRIVLELENLKTSNTLGQHLVAIDNLLNALDARSDASSAMLYPVEEIRGDVSFKGTQARRAFIRKQMEQESASTTGNKITQTEYDALVKAGHTPEQIKAEGFTVSP